MDDSEKQQKQLSIGNGKSNFHKFPFTLFDFQWKCQNIIFICLRMMKTSAAFHCGWIFVFSLTSKYKRENCLHMIYTLCRKRKNSEMNSANSINYSFCENVFLYFPFRCFILLMLAFPTTLQIPFYSRFLTHDLPLYSEEENCLSKFSIFNCSCWGKIEWLREPLRINFVQQKHESTVYSRRSAAVSRCEEKVFLFWSVEGKIWNENGKIESEEKWNNNSIIWFTNFISFPLRCSRRAELWFCVPKPPTVEFKIACLARLSFSSDSSWSDWYKLILISTSIREKIWWNNFSNFPLKKNENSLPDKKAFDSISPKISCSFKVLRHEKKKFHHLQEIRVSESRQDDNWQWNVHQNDFSVSHARHEKGNKNEQKKIPIMNS